MEFRTVESSFSEENEDELEWIPQPGNCWKECGKKGGLCPACMNYDTTAISGYCCSGANHLHGNGPIFNGDCPSNAIAIQKSNVHSCIIAKRKGKILFSIFDLYFCEPKVVDNLFHIWKINSKLRILYTNNIR